MKKISNIISTAASVFLFASAAFLFQCPPMDNGMYMNCHKANVTVAIISCIIVILGIALFFIKERRASALLSGVSAAAAVICTIVPGTLIQLCMMPEMTCRAVFRPIDIACSIIILVFAVIRLFFVIKEQ
jgi:hypothetical protein